MARCLGGEGRQGGKGLQGYGQGNKGEFQLEIQ